MCRDQESEPYLTAWRRWEPCCRDGCSGDMLMRNIVASVLEIARPWTPAEAALLDMLARDDQVGRTAYRLAFTLDADATSDLIGSLLFVSAFDGFGPGLVALVQTLDGLANEISSAQNRFGGSAPDDLADARRLRRIAAKWLRRRHLNSMLTDRRKWLEELADPRVQATPQENASENPTGGQAGRQSAEQTFTPLIDMMVVASFIGDNTSLEGRSIAKRYGRLLEPLPLHCGKLAVDVVELVLQAEAPNAGDLASAVLGDLRLRQSAGLMWTKFRPILLVGPPGSGKTRAVKRLAALLGMGAVETSAAGSSDSRGLTGTARAWHGTQPCAPVLAMLRHEMANPMIIVDEVDKASSSRHDGSVLDALLPFLEQETSAKHYDECLLTHVDLSAVNWVLVANDVSYIPAPLLSRVRVVNMEPPGPEHFDRLLVSVLHNIAAELGIDQSNLPELGPASIAMLHSGYLKRRCVRSLQRWTRQALLQTVGLPRVVH